MIKLFLKQNISFFLFILLCSIFSGAAFLLVEFTDNPTIGLKGFALKASLFCLVLLATYFFIWLIAINKYVFATIFPIFSILGSILAYFRYAYKTTLTPMIIDAAINNDLRTSLDLISFPLLTYFLICITIAILLIRLRFAKIINNRPAVHFFLSIALLLGITQSDYQTQQRIYQRFPFSVYYNIKRHIYFQHEIAKKRIEIALDARCNADSLIVVLVIGEALRADHLGLNGYYRNTTPQLLQKTAISFPYIYSEQTHTNASLPYILTRADSINEKPTYTETSFISVFKRCGFYTSWIGNQDPASSYVSFINESDTVLYAHPEKSVFIFSRWLDEDLLPHLVNIEKQAHPRKLFVLHSIGSHWYYKSHYSDKFEIFKPTTKSRLNVQCSTEEMINTYDNTILYTDYFLTKLIDTLKNKNTVIVYLSDHGEVLGEDGYWLHANGHIAAKNPACIIWFSDKYKAKNPTKYLAATENVKKRFRTDFLFHSILSVSSIESSIIDSSLNIFKTSQPK